MEKKIVYEWLFSEGKKDVATENQDNMYAGENFVAVIDGVSHKSSVEVGKKSIKIADIIVEAIEILDGQGKIPMLDNQRGKVASFEQAVQFINEYIALYLRAHKMDDLIGKMEATGVIYSKIHNQVWIVGDCRAVYDGTIVENPLRIDQVYIDIRAKIIEVLKQEGYREDELIGNDISREIIKDPKKLSTYIESEEARRQIECYRTQRMREVLIECGFSETEIESNGLIQKYYDPRVLQRDLKNNPNMKTFGYSVFNGKNTEMANCKRVTLPDDVKDITLSSDGFSSDAITTNNNLRKAIVTMRTRAKRDPLSVGVNKASHAAVETNRGRTNESSVLRIDDSTAIRFRIEQREIDVVSPETEADR